MALFGTLMQSSRTRSCLHIKRLFRSAIGVLDTKLADHQQFQLRSEWYARDLARSAGRLIVKRAISVLVPRAGERAARCGEAVLGAEREHLQSRPVPDLPEWPAGNGRRWR